MILPRNDTRRLLSWAQLAGAGRHHRGLVLAPNVTLTTLMDFELQVTDDDGASAVDVVRITVIK